MWNVRAQYFKFKGLDTRVRTQLSLALVEMNEIRTATITDAERIAKVILETSLACCFTEENPCPDWYLESVQAGAIEKFITAEDYVWLVAAHESEIVGVLAVANKEHIKYFFVLPSFQKSGVGRRLWDTAVHMGAMGPRVSVRSSMCAISVYEKLGFKVTDEPKSLNGMMYQPMVAIYG